MNEDEPEETEEQKIECQIIAVNDVDEFEEISPGHKEQDTNYLDYDTQQMNNPKAKYMKKFR